MIGTDYILWLIYMSGSGIITITIEVFVLTKG